MGVAIRRYIDRGGQLAELSSYKLTTVVAYIDPPRAIIFSAGPTSFMSM